MTKSHAVVGVALMAALGGSVATMAPAQAAPSSGQVAYGYLQSGSTCPFSAANAQCTVYLSYNGTNTTTHPENAGQVYCDGSYDTVHGAIGAGYLVGRYVGVVWGNGFGSINCH